MKRVCWPLLAALLLTIAACTAVPAATPTMTPTPKPAATHTPLPTFTPRPTATLTPTPSATPTPTPLPTPTPGPSPTPTQTPVFGPEFSAYEGLLVEPPARPFDDLFGGVIVNAAPPRRVPNAQRTFWVTYAQTMEHLQISARLHVQTEHVQMWVEEGVWHDVRQLQAAAAIFESHIYSTTRAAFGSEWTPGIDNDPHILILHAANLGDGVAGYAASADELPAAIFPFSNEAELIVVNISAIEVGSPAYYGLLARQFQRLIQWAHDRNEARWVKEGLADLAVRLNGFEVGYPVQAYVENPDTSLTNWSGVGTVAQRGAAYLFATYFHEQFGDTGTQTWVALPENGVAGIDRALDELGASIGFEDLYSGWLAANYVDSIPTTGTLPFHYNSLTLLPMTPTATYEGYPAETEGTVQQYGADYIALRGSDDLAVQFTGVTRTLLLDTSPHSGGASWWSNRADDSLTTLTWDLDLSQVETATLSYWTWYGLEEGSDYVTVQIGTEDGQEWWTLRPPSGTAENAFGNNPEWGYTGRSGNPPQWIEQQIDLSPYCGTRVRLRFAALTDEAVTGAGFLLDDVAVPQIGFEDGAESGDTPSPESAGFVRSDGLVPQRYLGLLIGIGEDITVERLAFDRNQRASWLVPLKTEGWSEAILILGGLAPLTTQPAAYRLTLDTVNDAPAVS
jgi:immune inhibitor A